MTEGNFRAQVNEVERIFNRLDFDFYREPYPRYSRLNGSLFDFNYGQLWRYLYGERLYDFKLADNALIQFRRYGGPSDTCYGYAYYECPYEVQTYVDFLEEQGFDSRSARDEFRIEYEESLENAPLKEAITPIRYDFSPHSYAEGKHPASHIHIGHMSDIRIGTKKLLKPVSFLLFILRHSYPSFWAVLLSSPIKTRCYSSVRTNLEDISPSYFGPNDNMEMHLL